MALVLLDRVRETSTTTGTGTITLLGAVPGFQAFSAIGNANQTYYTIFDQASGAWEVGVGTYTLSGTTLARNTVLSSSSGGTLVNFTAGTKDVFVTYPAERSVYKDTANTYTVQQAFDALTANSIALTSGTITTVPVNNTDIVNKQYADAIASGIHFHEAVALATTAALPTNTYNNGASGVGATLTATANGALSVDSTLTIAAERILVKNQVNGAHNGVYVVTQVGSAGTPYILTRATDFDSVGTGVDQIDEGDFFLVTSGVANLNTAWVQQTAPPITIGTTPIVFQQFSAPITYTAGTGLNESPTYTFNIANTGVTAATYGSSGQVPVIAVNAQGQITAVTNTAIAISAGAVSGLAASATTDTTDAGNITTGTLPSGRLIGAYTQVTGVGNLTAGTWNADTISVARGGTGQTTYTDGQLLIGNSTGNTLTKTTLTAGTGIGVTNGAGSITISANPVPATPLVEGVVFGETTNSGVNSLVTSLGYNSSTLNNFATAIGAGSQSDAWDIALGYDAKSLGPSLSGGNSIAIGRSSNVSAAGAVGIGYNANISSVGVNSVAIGYEAKTNFTSSIVLTGSGGLTAPNAGVFIDSMRDESAGSPNKTLKYNTTTKEIFYGTGGGGGGSGTVTDVSVVSANGFTGSVATSTTTPAITLTTSVTGLLQGNGTALSAVTIGSGLTFTAGTLSATGGGGASPATPTTLGTVFGSTSNSDGTALLGFNSSISASTNATAIGVSATALDTQAVAVGTSSRAPGYSVAVGWNANAGGVSNFVNTVVGANALMTSANLGVLIGADSKLNSSNGVAIGYNTTIAASSAGATGVGYNVQITAGYSTAIGYQAQSAINGASLGGGAKANYNGSIAIGANANAPSSLAGPAIILSAQTTTFTAPNTGVFVTSIRDEATGSPDKTLKYNTTTKEIFFGTGGGGGGSGTVTDVSVVSANGLAGTVATSTTTPAITLSTTVTGVLKGNGTAISAASAGTDYQSPILFTTTGTTGASTFVSNTLNIPVYQGQLTLTTTGTSGAATLVGDTLNIPQYSGGGGGSGTVTDVSIVSANGFAGTVATSTTTPAITLTTSITGLLKGNGTAISAAAAGTDYAPATSGSAILYGNGTGGFSSVTVGSGLSFTTGTLSAAIATTTTYGTVKGITTNVSAAAGSRFQTLLGSAATATGDDATAIGSSANAGGDDAIALGYAASATALRAIAIGKIAATSAQDSLAIGSQSTAQGGYSVALGVNSITGNGSGSGIYSIAIGSNANASPDNTIVITAQNGISPANSGVFIDSMRDESAGSPNKTLKYNTTTKEIFYGAGGGGGDATPTTAGSVFGNTTSAGLTGLGYNVSVTGANGTAIGTGAGVSAANSVAIGKLAVAGTTGSIVISGSGGMSPAAAGVYIDSMRDAGAAVALSTVFYNDTTKELAYNEAGINLTPQTVSQNITVPAGYNGYLVGPITVANGFSITVADGANFVIVQ